MNERVIVSIKNDDESQKVKIISTVEILNRIVHDRYFGTITVEISNPTQLGVGKRD